jgi:hypothetical protein
MDALYHNPQRGLLLLLGFASNRKRIISFAAIRYAAALQCPPWEQQQT